MKKLWMIFIFVLFCANILAQDYIVKTRPLFTISLYNEADVKHEILVRIYSGVYNGYTVDLCIEDIQNCKSAVFEQFKKEKDGKIEYKLRLIEGMWANLHEDIQDAVIREIIYYTWGHPKKKHPPLDVSIPELGNLSPLDLLSPHSKKMYLKFGKPEYLVGGLGSNAYGPNCWYNCISAIADKNSPYAKKMNIAKASWKEHRFMGPVEFRFHMNNFEEVATPQFGDIIRYYTDDVIFPGEAWIYGGEIHGAVYVGKEEYVDENGNKAFREIALTKNGRSDNDFLIFQDVKKMDETYLLKKLPKKSPLLAKYKGKDPRKKGYFRVKSGAKVLNPVMAGPMSDCYPAYLIDLYNYKDRWDCLSRAISSPSGKNCYDYPHKFLILNEIKIAK